MTKTANKKFLGGLAVVGVLLAFIIGWWLGHKPADAAAPHDHETTVAAAADTGKAETIWTCSMHPQVRQPDPGQCPICGMDLIPVAADDDPAEEGEVPRLRVSERSAALMNIQTWPVERRVVEREVRLLGRVNYDETRQRTITAWIPGRLDRLLVKVEGAHVQRGDPVAELYSPALISAQEELLQALRTARAREREDDPMVEATRERLRLLGLDDAQIREIEERGTVQDHVLIHSPLDGVITERIGIEGTYVEAGDPIAALAALDRVFIDLEAYERDLSWLAEGQTVRFSVEAFGGESFEGRIDQINPFVDARKRTAQVRVLVENPEGILKPGMYAQGVVKSRLGDSEGVEPWRGEPPLVIPATAALITGRRAVVYVKIFDTERPTFELRQVTLGPRAGERFVVRDGVREGELVVTHGSFKIDAELQLRGQPSMMAPSPEPVGQLPPAIDPNHPALILAPDEVPQDVAEQAVDLVETYFLITGGLAADDFPAAREAVTDLQQQAGAIDAMDLPGPVARAWNSISPQLHESGDAMAEAKDLDGLRSHLEPLTNQMELVVRSLTGGNAYPVFRAHCPMALNNEGADWLQQDEVLNNPYMGTAMPTCGEIRYQVAPDPAEIREGAEPEELREEPQPVASPEEVPKEFGQQLAVLLDRYLEFVDALAADDFQSAQTAAGRMLDDLGAIDAELLPEGHLESWRRLHSECEAALNGMIQAGDIERIRELLQPCTTALEVAVISFQVDQVPPLYRAYCPMAFDDLGGTWLQRDREIRNPYLGEAMVDCGEILGVLDPEHAER